MSRISTTVDKKFGNSDRVMSTINVPQVGVIITKLQLDSTFLYLCDTICCQHEDYDTSSLLRCCYIRFRVLQCNRRIVTFCFGFKLYTF